MSSPLLPDSIMRWQVDRIARVVGTQSSSVLAKEDPLTGCTPLQKKKHKPVLAQQRFRPPCLVVDATLKKLVKCLSLLVVKQKSCSL